MANLHFQLSWYNQIKFDWSGHLYYRHLQSSVDQYSPSKPSIDTLVNTWSILNDSSAESQLIFAEVPLSVDWYIWVSQVFPDYWSSVNHHVDQVLIEFQLITDQHVDQDVNQKVTKEALWKCPLALHVYPCRVMAKIKNVHNLKCDNSVYYTRVKDYIIEATTEFINMLGQYILYKSISLVGKWLRHI